MTQILNHNIHVRIMDNLYRIIDFEFLKDGEELELGTDPLNDDTDWDSVLDGLDADPLDPNVQ